jgi:hypothetical protein
LNYSTVGAQLYGKWWGGCEGAKLMYYEYDVKSKAERLLCTLQKETTPRKK